MARTPRIRHLRHGTYDRVRHAHYLLGWITAQAARLAVTGAALFQTLKDGASALAVEAMEGALAPVNSIAPAILGTPTENEELTIDLGTWSDMSAGSYTFQWKRDTVDIGGATSATYTLVTADVGTSVTVSVTATNSIGSSAVTTAGVGPVAAA